MDYYIIHYILDVKAKEFHRNFMEITILRRSPRFPIMGGTVFTCEFRCNYHLLTSRM